jgi:hypothetical protein
MSSADSLGEERDTFRPRRGKIIIGLVLGFVAGAGGIALAVAIFRSDLFHHGPTRDRVAAFLVMVLAGFGGPLIGAVLLGWMRNLLNYRVTVFDGGFEHEYRDEVETCRWSDIEHIDEIFTSKEVRVLKVPGASLKRPYRRFIVHCHDGDQFRFNAKSLDRFPLLATYLEEARDRHGVPWAVAEQ